MVNASRCDVWVVCMCMPSGVHCCLFRWFLGKCFFAGSASLHDWFLHFLESAFNCTSLGPRHIKIGERALFPIQCTWYEAMIVPTVATVHY